MTGKAIPTRLWEARVLILSGPGETTDLVGVFLSKRKATNVAKRAALLEHNSDDPYFWKVEEIVNDSLAI